MFFLKQAKDRSFKQKFGLSNSLSAALLMAVFVVGSTTTQSNAFGGGGATPDATLGATTGATYMSNVEHKVSNVERTPLRLTRPRMHGADVYALQEALKRRGYRVGPIDGVFGRSTARILRVFQQDLGIPVTGAADPATMRALNFHERPKTLYERVNDPSDPIFGR